MTPLRQRILEDLQVRNYAPTTVAAYIRNVAQFAKHFGKSPELLGPEQIREYQLYLIKERGVSLSSYIQAVSGLRFLYTNTLHLQVGIENIPLPRYEKKLPIILSPEEVRMMLAAPKNLGHRTILTTMYASGPRVSEVVNLKLADIDGARKVIWIRGGKGHKATFDPVRCWRCEARGRCARVLTTPVIRPLGWTIKFGVVDVHCSSPSVRNCSTGHCAARRTEIPRSTGCRSGDPGRASHHWFQRLLLDAVTKCR